MSGRRLVYVLLTSLSRMIFLLGFNARVFGQNHVRDKGGVLIVSNHQSFLDPILLACGVERSLSFMARENLFDFPGFGALIRLLNAFPVSLEGPDMAAMREAVRRLREGWPVLVFPEGTRTADGRVGSLRPGVALIAQRAGVPVVPAAVEGAFQAWPRGGRLRPHPVWVAYGRPLAAAACRRMPRDELLAHLRQRIVELQAGLRKRAARARGVPVGEA